MSSQKDDRELAFTGERVVVGKTPPFLVLEHLLRYRFAARFARGRKVLDVGCGTGYGAALLAEQARLVVGVDNAADAIAYAHENYRRRHLHYALADCRRLPLRDRAFDLVVMFEVIEHIAEQAECLGEIHRVLAPTGTLILSTPDVARPTKAIEEFNPFHAKELTEAELRELLRPHFRHVEVLYQHELSGSSLRAATDAGEKGVELVEDSSHTTAAKYFVAVCGARPSPIPVGRLMGATGIEHQIAIVRHLRYLEKEIQALLRQREEYIENLAAHRREIEALQHDREARQQDYARNLAAQQREIEALQRDREARQQEYMRNLAAHEETIRNLDARLAELENRLQEEVQVRDRQLGELERQRAAQRMELDWLYRWLPVNKLARRLLYGRNLRRRLFARLGLSPLQKATKLWGERARERQDPERPIVSWSDSPLVVELYINPIISGNTQDGWMIWVAKKYFRRPVQSALSIGCGDGSLERHALQLQVADHFEAFDASPEAVKIAKAKARELGYADRVRYAVADVNQCHLDPQKYDAVFASMSLHHIDQLERLLREVQCSLKPGGLFIMIEYIGPDQFQWTDAQLRLANEMLLRIPESYRKSLVTGRIKSQVIRQTREQMTATDPTEAIHSSQIVPLVQQMFEIVERIYFAGTLLHPVLEEIAGNFRSDQQDVAILRDLFEFEQRFLNEGVISSDFTLIVARARG